MTWNTTPTRPPMSPKRKAIIAGGIGAFLLLAAIGNRNASSTTEPSSTRSRLRSPWSSLPVADRQADPEVDSDTYRSADPEVDAAPTPIPTAILEPGFVSRQSMADAWPLTVESGVVYCTSASAVMFRTVDAGDVVDGYGLFAINGTARTLFPDLRQIEDIWIVTDEWTDPELGLVQLRKSIGPLLEIGLSLC